MAIQNELNAVNLMLTAIGEGMIDNVDEPEAKLALQSLDFVLNSLPYTSLDFENTLSELPSEVYSYVVVKAARRFQAITIGSETLNAFSESDEMDAKRLIIRKKIIPKTLLNEVEEECRELLSFANSVPKSLKEDLALLKLQALLFVDPNTYIISVESVQENYINFKKRLIARREVPNEILEATAKELFSRYGFSKVIPNGVLENTNIQGIVRHIASFNFQSSILTTDNIVISEQERNQYELDFRVAIVTNRIFPRELYDKIMLEFVNTYGITPSEHISVVEQYLRTKTLYNLQAMLIADEKIRPISYSDMDNAEASLITNLIVPKNLYSKTYELTKTELAIEPEIDDKDVPKEVKEYALVKAALKHQLSCISDPSKYVFNERDLVNFKSIAWQSLPKISMLNNSNTNALVNNTILRTATASNEAKSAFRLKVVTNDK
ncbi:hypothetical protein [Campylobacter hyointestinalis]|uniref:Uncharacterized protein n=1 Tax=Campylobacter hyointestinalis subsp. hyointestinalis TaxID=91352 RepID=A0A0S4RAR5_CAMHY|nr:hypothetical protein [Campylobacter hyointestinalis]PPB51707.1 hypothetical protein CDQ69_08885 [Campylobacter hyointestinalis subsp. hyointestinalis]PPB55978.1 hypothetical protein CDQ67_01705 [Campylobacter hyointestinalis subsp. hyointestinalis]PPB61447.1 hypothetical protein CDQ74_08685 [Campylobacter hyointestinalis subsp. hyointestinalis]CUU71158.1 Uncharacterised protein [Campylobacter hyointestinalis subsp. hyointestinalis]